MPKKTARDAEEALWANGAVDRAMEVLRAERNRLLVETDYLGNSDVTMSSAWTTYRQALRDITNGVDSVSKLKMSHGRQNHHNSLYK